MIEQLNKYKFIEKTMVEEKQYLDEILKAVDPNILLDDDQRKVVLTGRSMVNVTDVATQIGEMTNLRYSPFRPYNGNCHDEYYPDCYSSNLYLSLSYSPISFSTFRLT